MTPIEIKSMEALCSSLKKMVIEECNVRGVSAEQIANDDPIIAGQGILQLDSLDAVEIVGALDRQLGLALDGVGASRRAFRSFQILSEFVTESADQERIQAFINKYSS